MKTIKWLIFAIFIAGFIASSTFGKFLVGLKSIFSNYALVINWEVSPEVIFFAISVVVFLYVVVYSIFRD